MDDDDESDENDEDDDEEADNDDLDTENTDKDLHEESDTAVKSGDEVLSETEEFKNINTKDTSRDPKIVDVMMHIASANTNDEGNKEADTNSDGDDK